MASSVEQVFEDLNFPSATRLKRVLTARGIPFNTSEVDRLVRKETTRQVQAPRYKFNGKIAASRLHSRWFADLIDFSAAPSASAGKDVGLRPTESGGKVYLGGSRRVLQKDLDRGTHQQAASHRSCSI